MSALLRNLKYKKCLLIKELNEITILRESFDVLNELKVDNCE